MLKLLNENIDLFWKTVAMSGPGLVAVVSAVDWKVVFCNKAFLEYIDCPKEGDCNILDLIEEYHHDRFFLQLADGNQNLNKSAFFIYNLKGKNNVNQAFYIFLSKIEPPEGVKETLFHLLLLPDNSKWGMPFTTFDTRELFLEHFDADDFGTFEWLMAVDKVYWSNGIYRIYEVDKSVMKIDNLFARQFMHPLDTDRVVAYTREKIAKAEDIDVEFRIITQNGNEKILHSLARIIRNDKGEPVKFVGSVRDVTKQRLIEQDLELKVEELHRSNRELESFAYAAGHDMLEPLRKITTFSDRLMEKYADVLEGDGAMYLSRMVNSAENMRTLINSLLDLSRITKPESESQVVDLNLVIQEVLSDLELKVEETGAKLSYAKLPVIPGVYAQMKQLFYNIVVNGLKFKRDEVSPVITIDCKLVDSIEGTRSIPNVSGPFYYFTICDNGIGFEVEYADRIFQIFQRLHGKSEYPGSGIGLAICKKIVEHHSGVIYATSTLGQGSCFHFYLPASKL